jgi:hypothetical protein
MKPKPWFSVFDGTTHQLDGSRTFGDGATVGGVNNWIQKRQEPISATNPEVDTLNAQEKEAFQRELARNFEPVPESQGHFA